MRFGVKHLLFQWDIFTMALILPLVDCKTGSSWLKPLKAGIKVLIVCNFAKVRAWCQFWPPCGNDQPRLARHTVEIICIRESGCKKPLKVSQSERREDSNDWEGQALVTLCCIVTIKTGHKWILQHCFTCSVYDVSVTILNKSWLLWRTTVRDAFYEGWLWFPANHISAHDVSRS